MMGQPDSPPYAYNFFTGVPSPAAAGLVLLPMVISFEFGEEFFSHPLLVAIFLIGVALLMVSRIHTFAFKRVRVPRAYFLLVLLLVGLFAAFLVTAPWITMSLLGVAYLLSIPFGERAFRKLKAKAEALQTPITPSPEENPAPLG
jgi:CDP-diacylglycerol--serine O-phosphatidyltransferase